MAKWYIVKRNWGTKNKEYLGLGGDSWSDMEMPPDGEKLLAKILVNGNYVKLSGMLYQVVTDYSMAKEYFLYQNQLDLNPLLISVTDDTEVEDVDGYDFGDPAGGYSVIESEILAPNDEVLIRKYLNEHFLFKDMDALRDFLDFIEDTEDVEELDGYQAVGIKGILG